ncbi:hypothetical protein DOTSEDRAFT_38149 [Dothistroma septosporum NZE10]|uniref:Uncharacterized protein n=1 Tax=Dothistroma septosporum (strain NZE10 / CBS 128990) TaxID=675120 RepID=N1PF02_DOTSN|nr:hypothetical protein DOTSEDRAFT_38149 [Dothistroma septosporum NZE10]
MAGPPHGSNMNLSELQSSLDSLHRHDEVFDPDVDDFIPKDPKVAIQHGQRQRPRTYWRAQCSMRGFSDQGTTQEMQARLRNRKQDSDTSLRQTQARVEKVDVPNQAWELVDRRLETEKKATRQTHRKHASISRVIAKQISTPQHDFDITGHWTISSKLQDHPSCPAGHTPTMTILFDLSCPPIINKRNQIFPQYFARFDFGIVRGIMRMSKNKPWALEGPVREDIQRLGWVYRWRGRGVDGEVQDSGERKLYRLIFSPDGRECYGKFSSRETSLVSFSGRKVDGGEVREEGSQEEWDAFRVSVVRR